jgi:formylglycine-generating enzyme required for sulfatase activity
LKEGYLGLRGYRLPTEAEWEYGCRAGAVTSRYYGETEELLHRYSWYAKNSGERAWPVGSKMPNDLGLFDMHGNVYTWCQASYDPYPTVKEGEIIEEEEDNYSITTQNSQDYRVLRGGSFFNSASFARSAFRNVYRPATRDANYGVRPARTCR